ncbi:hypothetical protein GQR58_013794 [Nymphon striatum]|nr:hypothetical protein GQR58_013794 [Nymphon striatum]
MPHQINCHHSLKIASCMLNTRTASGNDGFCTRFATRASIFNNQIALMETCLGHLSDLVSIISRFFISTTINFSEFLKLLIDFRRNSIEPCPVIIKNLQVERTSTYKYLGTIKQSMELLRKFIIHYRLKIQSDSVKVQSQYYFMKSDALLLKISILKRKASFFEHIARGSAGEELKMIVAEGWRKVGRGRRRRRWMDDVELVTGTKDVRKNIEMAEDKERWREKFAQNNIIKALKTKLEAPKQFQFQILFIVGMVKDSKAYNKH